MKEESTVFHWELYLRAFKETVFLCQNCSRSIDKKLFDAEILDLDKTGVLLTLGGDTYLTIEMVRGSNSLDLCESCAKNIRIVIHREPKFIVLGNSEYSHSLSLEIANTRLAWNYNGDLEPEPNRTN